MENSPSNSIEKQIDNFLEHFKRSASKAMDADWCSTVAGGSVGTVAATGGATASAAGSTPVSNDSTANSSAVNQTRQQQQQQPLRHPLLQRTKSRSSCLDISDLSASPNLDELKADTLLFMTLSEIDSNNYLYLFERCKVCRVNVRQLRYLQEEHVRELVPPAQMGIRAEFEFMLRQWQNKQNDGTAQSIKASHASRMPTADVGTMTTPINSQPCSPNADPMSASTDFCFLSPTPAVPTGELISTEMLKTALEESLYESVASDGGQTEGKQ